MVKQYNNDIELINTNVRDDLIAELDANISGFRDIAWRSTSKRFTKTLYAKINSKKFFRGI